MIVTNEPGDDISESMQEPPEAVAALQASAAETPVSIPKGDPQIIIKGLQDYDNSLHALLKKADS